MDANGRRNEKVHKDPDCIGGQTQSTKVPRWGRKEERKDVISGGDAGGCGCEGGNGI